MFLGRKRELAALQDEYEADGFRMSVLYGRRRVGKTELLNHFSKNKEVIFFTASESSIENNLIGFENAVFEAFSSGGIHPHFKSFEEAFFYIGEKTGKKKLLVIIDEYPYLAETDKSISSVLQKCIDTSWNKKNIYLILCGSSVSFMEDEVLAGKSPLYGRRTSQMDVRPFNYKISSEFVPDYTFDLKKRLWYMVSRGVLLNIWLFLILKKIWMTILKGCFFRKAAIFLRNPRICCGRNLGI